MSSAAEARERKDWPHLLSAGAHVGAVLGVLVLGAVFQASPPNQATSAGPERSLPAPVRQVEELWVAEPPAPPAPLADLPPAAPASAAVAGDSSSLTLRAQRDAERLARGGEGYTLQIAMLCDAAGVRAHLDRHGDLEPFHVLPVHHGGRDCFRICWGRYPSAEAARLASDIPGALASAGVFPAAVSAVLE